LLLAGSLPSSLLWLNPMWDPRAEGKQTSMVVSSLVVAPARPCRLLCRLLLRARPSSESWLRLRRCYRSCQRYMCCVRSWLRLCRW
jgi:hypothetical protein